jgi:hypothetical protein
MACKNSNASESNAFLSAAYDYAARGWPVVPVVPRDKNPWPDEWQKVASTDLGVIAGWWSQQPDSNVGALLGPRSGLIDVECDSADAERELGMLLGEDVPVVPTYIGKRGKHRLFQYSPDLPEPDKVVFHFRGIEFRTGNGGKGAQSVLPPSIHPEGPTYRWLVHPDEADPVPVPAPALATIHAELGAGMNGNGYAKASDGDRIPTGQRNRTLASLAGSMRRRSMRAEEILAALLVVNQHRCDPPLSEDEVAKIAQSIGSYPPASGEFTGRAYFGDGKGGNASKAGPRSRANVPRQIPPYAAFPLKMLPPILRDYVDCSAQAIGCDPALVALPALAVVAGCIGNSCALMLKRGWIEPCIVWAVTVAPSGQLKSPAYAMAVDPLLEIQMDLTDAHEVERTIHDQALSTWKAKPKAERGEKPAAPEPPACYVTGDATIEAVGELLADNPRGLLLTRDELDGWFQGFTRYKGRSGGTDRPHWLELHRSGTLRIHRLTRERGPLSVRRACCSVAGTIQPSVLARALDDDALAAGLGARFLLAMPPAQKRRWTEAEVDEDTAARYGKLLNDLLSLERADLEKRKPHVHVLTPGAKALWVSWFGRWGEAIQAAEGEQAAALAKLEGYAARLALLHHTVSLAAAGSRTLQPVTETSVRAAIALVEWFAGESARVYTILKESAEERDRRRLVEWIAGRGGSASVRDLQRANRRRWPTREMAEDELQELVDDRLGVWVQCPASPNGGAGARFFRLHASAPDISDKTPGDSRDAPDTRADMRSDSRGQSASENSTSVFSLRAWGGTVSPGESRVSDLSGAAAAIGDFEDIECKAASVGREPGEDDE